MRRVYLAIIIALQFTKPLFADGNSSKRVAEIRHIEHLQNRKFRAYLSVFEAADVNSTRYPITTLDRSAFQIFTSGELDLPLKVSSLWTFATLTPPRPRALIVAFNESNSLPAKMAIEVRKSVAESLPGLRSDFFAVLASGGGRILELAALDPVQSENIKALQRKVNESQSLGGENGSALALCGARDRFVRWQDFGVDTAEQKTVILIGPAGNPCPVAQDLFQKCWIDLRTMGVRVIHVFYKLEGQNLVTIANDADLSYVAEGGNRLQVQSALDVFPALSNIASTLNDEYVVEFELAPTTVLSPQISLFAQISYHGDVFASAQKSTQIPMTVVLSSLPEMQKDELELNATSANWMVDVVLIVCVLGAMILLFMLIRSKWRLYSETTVCNSCGIRVAKNYANCPFKQADCVAKLTVLSGVHVGRQFPLFSGRNSLGKSSKCTIQVKDHMGIKRRHAFIEIKNGKAVFSTLSPFDRINGWPVSEPRLIGKGSVVSLNGMQLHFESRPEQQ